MALSTSVNAVTLLNTQEGHNKFYTISVSGTTLTCEWGKIGCKQAQSSTKTYATMDDAIREANKVYKQKSGPSKGYTVVEDRLNKVF
jgi:hypothetical protein